MFSVSSPAHAVLWVVYLLLLAGILLLLWRYDRRDRRIDQYRDHVAALTKRMRAQDEDLAALWTTVFGADAEPATGPIEVVEPPPLSRQPEPTTGRHRR